MKRTQTKTTNENVVLSTTSSNVFPIFPPEIFFVILSSLGSDVNCMFILYPLATVCKTWNNFIPQCITALHEDFFPTYTSCVSSYNFGKAQQNKPERLDFNLDNIMKKLVNLNYLNLKSSSGVTDNGIRFLTNLRTLNISGNLPVTSKGIELLTNLSDLDLSFNNIISNKTLTSLTNLTRLNIRQNQIINSETVSVLTNLKELNISYNNRITNDALFLPNLTFLDLTDNNHYYSQITATGINQLTSLILLEISHNFHFHINILTRNIHNTNLRIMNEHRLNPDDMIDEDEEQDSFHMNMFPYGSDDEDDFYDSDFDAWGIDHACFH